MARGKTARIIRRKVRNSVRSAKRWPKKKLVKAYGQVSGKLVAVSVKKNRRKSYGKKFTRFKRSYKKKRY